MSQRFYSEKVKRAAHLLLYKRGKMLGAKGWELKARLGKNYDEVLTQLNDVLKEVDLEVRKVEAQGEIVERGESEDEARYVVGLKGTISTKEARMMGWRIDNLAALTMVLSYAVSKQGKTTRDDIENALIHKFGNWRSATMLDAFIRQGYLDEDENGMVRLGWRAKAEVDLRNLMTLLAEVKS